MVPAEAAKPVFGRNANFEHDDAAERQVKEVRQEIGVEKKNSGQPEGKRCPDT
jgi:hypothetical protein